MAAVSLRRTSRDARMVVLGSRALDQVLSRSNKQEQDHQITDDDDHCWDKERLREVLDGGIEPNAWDVYLALLRQCGNVRAIEEGRRVHALLSAIGADTQTLWGNFVMQMYGKCGSANEAAIVFEKLEDRKNDFSWTIMLTAYAQNGHLLEAGKLLQRMSDPGVVALTIMVTAQARHGDLSDARRTFEMMTERNQVSWNALITAYARKGHFHEAAMIFCRMDQDGFSPNDISFTSLLESCARPQALNFGNLVHRELLNRGRPSVVVATALVNMYGNCGDPRAARAVFDGIPQPNSVSWSSIISAYGRNGRCEAAVEMFRRMDVEGVRASEVTLVCVIDACASLRELKQGKILHGTLVTSGGKISTDIKVENALVNMYAKCGSLIDAKAVFDGMRARNVVSWTALIAAYAAEECCCEEAFDLFRVMDLEGHGPNEVTLVAVLDACSKMATLSRGLAVHRGVVAMDDVVVATSLVNMYAKCGSVARAWVAFAEFERQSPNSSDDAVLCNAMLSALVQSGDWRRALAIFLDKELQGMNPTRITFIAVLSACAQAGLVQDGLRYFESLWPDFGIQPTLFHYECVVDLLGRAGLLDDAEDLVFSMPFVPDSTAWLSLLSACNSHSDPARALRIAQHLQSTADDPVAYVLLSNTVAKQA